MATEETEGGCALQKAKLLVMADVSSVAKDGHNVGQKYDYATAAGVFGTVRAAMIEHGLTISISCGGDVETIQKLSRKETTILHRLVPILITLTHAPSGESESGVVYGEAQDSGDKAVNKCYTTGLKYYILSTFLLPQGWSDPEADAKTDKDPGRVRGPEPSVGDKWAALEGELTPFVKDLLKADKQTTKGKVAAYCAERDNDMKRIQADLVESIYLRATTAQTFGGSGKPEKVMELTNCVGKGEALYMLPGEELECACAAFESDGKCEHVAAFQAAQNQP